MCSNLIDSLECHMDDLVDSFENFVKKSLIILMVAISAIIAMFIYALRVITERQVTTGPSPEERANFVPPIDEIRRSDSTLNNKSEQNIKDNHPEKDFIKNSYVLQFSKSIPSTCTLGANTTPLPYVPSFNERVLRDIGFTNCSKSENSSNESLTHQCSDSRLSIPSPPTSELKSHYNHSRKDTPLHAYGNQKTTSKDFRWIIELVSKFLGTGYSIMSGNYLTIITVFVVVLLSYIIPDLSQKIHAANDLKDMKKVLTMMSEEVSRAEAACCTAADKVCHLHLSMHDDATETALSLQDHSACTSHCVHVTQSQPVQIEKKVGVLRRIFFPKKNASHKELTIMSYLYTDSFDGNKKHNQ